MCSESNLKRDLFLSEEVNLLDNLVYSVLGAIWCSNIFLCPVLFCVIKNKGRRMNKKVLSLFIQVFRFGLIGVVNTLVSTVLTYTFLFLFKKFLFFSGNFDTQIFVSSFLGFSLSFFNAYFWNKKFIFGSTKDGTKSFFKSYFCYFLSWSISYLSTYILTNVLFFQKIYIPILSLFVTVPLNFLANKFWAFK